tara:strand:- start:406 stop:1221 length:816 start_codon:yes stop_codon:yes gene_type:complete
MKFKIEKTKHPNISKYRQVELKIATAFSNDVLKELKDYIKAIVLFGSTTKSAKPIVAGEHDIDILIIVDDLSIKISPEFVEAYRIIVEKIALRHSKRLHITTLKLTNFWEYMRVGDPIGINMLRSGYSLYDTGFFDPLQALLRQGRVRPSQESIWTYFARAPSTLKNSRWHLLQATLDLYWGVIDSAHAALMSIGEIPPSPGHVAKMMEEKLVKTKLIRPQYVETMEKFYNLSKMIVHRQLQIVKGKDYELYYKEAEEFIEVMRRLIEKKF